MPFSTEPKTPVDELMDLMHHVPNCLALYHRLSYMKGQSCTGPDQDMCIAKLESDVSQLIWQFEKWESEFISSPRGEDAIAYSKYTGINRSSLDTLPADTAIATINAAYVILHSILVSSGSSQLGSRSKILSSAEAILNASDNLISDQVKASTWGMIVFPLSVVRTWSPSPDQQSVASEHLRKWAVCKGVERFIDLMISEMQPEYS